MDAVILSDNTLLGQGINELPVYNVREFVNCMGQQGIKFECNGEYFSLLREYDEPNRFELGYYDDTQEFSFQVDRHLTPMQVIDRVHELAIRE